MAYRLTKGIFKAGISCMCLLLSGCLIGPQPIPPSKELKDCQALLKEYLHHQVVINKPISLPEAIARTLKYNLDNKVRETQILLANRQLNLARVSLLPSMENDYTFSKRNNPYTTLDKNFQPSVSTVNPRTEQDYKLHWTWNLLDAGLSFVRAKQQADRVLIAREQQRRVEQQLITQVISAYWQAYSAQQMLGKVEQYRQQVKKALVRSRKAIKTRVASNIVQLDYQQLLIKSMRQLIKIELQLIQARENLSRLMNATPGIHFVLKKPPEIFKKLPTIKVPMRELDTITLVFRPELREADYKIRIAKHGVVAAVMELLPTADFEFGYNYTSNRYVKNQLWYDTNINAAWDALKLLTVPFAITAAKTQMDVEKLTLAALTMGALSQVRVAYDEYHIWQQDYQYSKLEATNANQLYLQTQRLAAAKMSNKQAIIRRGMTALAATLDRDIALSKAYESLGRLRLATGLNYLPLENVNHESLGSLTKFMRAALIDENEHGFEKEVGTLYSQLHLPLTTNHSPHTKH